MTLAAPSLLPDTAQLLEALPGGLVWLDGQGRVALANPAARAMLGEPLLTQPWAEVIERAFAPQPDDGLQVSLRDGRRIQLAISHLEGRAGQLIQLVDMTPTRAWAEQQSHARRLADLGRMAATLAHQIRTPLSAAMLYGANLASPGLTPLQREQFQQRLMQRLTDIERQISDILLFIRPDSAPLADRLGVQAWLGRSLEAAAPLLAAGGVELVRHGGDEATILGNANALTSVLLNLIENAIQAGASRIRLETVVAEGEVHLSLEDNGRGMAPEVQAQLFTPFFTTRSQGTGLGLAAVAAVARAHQGRVAVQSVPGQGSCFTLAFPLATLIEETTP